MGKRPSIDRHGQLTLLPLAWNELQNARRAPALGFYRTRDDLEVDLIAETARGLHAVEVKSGATIAEVSFKNLAPLRQDLGAELVACWLLYGGERAEQRHTIRVLPWSNIGELWAALAQ